MVAITFNNQGLYEINYLYTDEEMQKFDPELLTICKQYKDTTQWFDSTLSCRADKTWMGTYIEDDDIETIRKFLTGYYNELYHQEEIAENEIDPEDDYWSWSNNEDNDLYEYSDTLRKYLDIVSNEEYDVNKKSLIAEAYNIAVDIQNGTLPIAFIDDVVGYLGQFLDD